MPLIKVSDFEKFVTEWNDGKLVRDINRWVNQAVEDMQRRPQDQRARTINLQLEFTPGQVEEGELLTVGIKHQIKTKLPTEKGVDLVAKVRKSAKGPMLVANDLAPDNPDQKSIE